MRRRFRPAGAAGAFAGAEFRPVGAAGAPAASDVCLRRRRAGRLPPGRGSGRQVCDGGDGEDRDC